jgi:hypothetical protein
LAEQRDIESQFRGSQIDGFFLRSKQIDQDGSDRPLVENVSHMPVSRASPATAAPMSEHDEAFSLRRQGDVGSEFDAINGYFNADVLHC